MRIVVVILAAILAFNGAAILTLVTISMRQGRQDRKDWARWRAFAEQKK